MSKDPEWVKEFRSQSTEMLKKIYCESPPGFADESIFLASAELQKRGIKVHEVWSKYCEDKEQAEAIASDFAEIREWDASGSRYCDGLGCSDVRALLKEYDRLKGEKS